MDADKAPIVALFVLLWFGIISAHFRIDNIKNDMKRKDGR